MATIKTLLIILFLSFFNLYCPSIAYSLDTSELTNKTLENFSTLDLNNLDQSKIRLSDSILVTQIPESLQDVFFIEFLNIDTVSLDSKLRIKGYNKLLGDVYINSQKIACDKNGNFSYQYKLKNYGINDIAITFTTNNFKFITLLKKVNYLFSPKLNNKNIEDKFLFTYFYNLDLIYEIRKKPIKSYVTRADLAYFFYKLNNETMVLNENALIVDVEKDSTYYFPIQHSLEEGVLGTFPDGKFYPNKKITKLELLISLARFQNLNLRSLQKTFIFKDFKQSHWASRFVQASINQGWISETDYLYPSKFVLFEDFIKLVNKLESVKFLISGLDNVNYETYDSNLINEFHQQLSLNLVIEKEKSKNKIEFKLEGLDNHQIIFDDSITLNGTVVPSQEFYIRTQKIEPDIKGDFNLNIDLVEGKNTFDINFNNQNSQLTIYHLVNYNDLSNHWLREPAAKLRYLDYLDTTPTFNPKQVITRLDYIKYAASFFETDIPTSQNKLEIIDLDDLEEYQAIVQYLVSNDVFSIYETNKFYPNKPMKRVEALAATMKFLDLKYGNQNITNIKIPFWDVPKNHWGIDYIKKAYANNYISKSVNFYPEKFITKDQLIAMFYKLPNVETKVKEYFEN